MDWLKLTLSLLRTPEYLSADPVERATWLNLLAYCADQENGGRIVNCANWKDRMWQQLCGVTQEETHLENELYTWDGDDLVITFYPISEQDKCKRLRSNGSRGGRPKNQTETKAETKNDEDRNQMVNQMDNHLVNQEPESGLTEQSRAEQSRTDKSRAEQRRGAPPGCGGLDLQTVVDWIHSKNGAIPDKPRAESHARELLEEMDARKWRLHDGEPVANPLGLVIARLKSDGIYTPQRS